jgi:hypothetical protein
MLTYFLILVIMSVLMIVLGTRTSLLRDNVVNKVDFVAYALATKNLHPKASFSLAKSQLAFWTVIVFSSFLYLLFRFKFSIPALNQANLILLGMSVATTATAKLIDDSQQLNGDLSQDHPSEGFLRDILSDKNGVSMHRLQNVLWTFAVGIIYVHYVCIQTGLPDETVLTNNLLILMGISSGAYVGIKTTENSKPGGNTPPAV